MISETLVFLRDHLNTYLRMQVGGGPDELQEDKVVFLDGEKMDPVTFKLEAVSALLINVEEENTLRAPDLYRKTAANGGQVSGQPDIRLNLYVLFVARCKQYEKALRYLSLIIGYFQNHRVLTHQTAPELNDKIEKLVMELVTLPFSEQNEVWSALRTTYHPSVLYKVKMLVFRDEETLPIRQVQEKTLKVSQ